MAELVSNVKSGKKTLQEKMDSLYWQHGYHGEQLLNVTMTGSAGMDRMVKLMQNFRTSPPAILGGMKVSQVLDYQALTATPVGGKSVPLTAPTGDMVILELAEEGNYIAVRPSGTEPKVKFYMFTYTPAEQLHNLELTKSEMAQRMANFEIDLKAYSEKA